MWGSLGLASAINELNRLNKRKERNRLNGLNYAAFLLENEEGRVERA